MAAGKKKHLRKEFTEKQRKEGQMKKNRRKNDDLAKLRALSRELQAYEQNGTRLYLEGRPCGTADIVNACILAEEQNYMRDYISDDSHHIRKINFIRVRKD